MLYLCREPYLTWIMWSDTSHRRSVSSAPSCWSVLLFLSPTQVAVLFLYQSQNLAICPYTSKRGKRTKCEKMTDHGELNFIPHFSIWNHGNWYLVLYCKGVDIWLISLWIWPNLFLCFLCLLHSADLWVMTLEGRIKKVLESFTWDTFLLWDILRINRLRERNITC